MGSSTATGTDVVSEDVQEEDPSEEPVPPTLRRKGSSPIIDSRPGTPVLHDSLMDEDGSNLESDTGYNPVLDGFSPRIAANLGELGPSP